jgi:hypothetical protein
MSQSTNKPRHQLTPHELLEDLRQSPGVVSTIEVLHNEFQRIAYSDFALQKKMLAVVLWQQEQMEEQNREIAKMQKDIYELKQGR